MKQQRIELPGLAMTGLGRTKAEACADLDRQIGQALAHSYDPRIISHGGRQAIVWRTPDGLVSAYTTMPPKHGVWTPTGGTCHHGRDADMIKVIGSIQLNLAMLAVEALSIDTPTNLKDSPHLLTDYRSWLGFQRAYRWHYENHKEANEYARHYWACEHAKEFLPHPSSEAAV
jgi:hypothetical protein